MKWLILSSFTLVAVAGCGARTPMESCALGSEQCGCLSGACNPGLVCVADVCVSPGSSPAGSGGYAGGGGYAGSGGYVGSGGSAGGGYVGTGGHVGSGGYVGSGGHVGSGGWAGGGYVGSGGCAVSGSWVVGGGLVVVGCPPTGGYVGGGVFGGGGRGGSGGVVGSGGVSGMSSGGRTGAGGSTAFVSFLNGRANGLIDGWGWVALGANDTLVSPTCAGQPITSTSPCTTTTTWSSNTALCITGTIPALPPNPSASDNNDNWGIMVSVNCHDPLAPLGGSFRSIMINFIGVPTTGLRAVVHRMGDPPATNYCTAMSSDTTIIAFTAFNTACSDGSGKSLTLADVPNLDWIGIQVPSTSSVIKPNLCFDGVMLVP